MKFLSVPSLEKYSLELSHIDLGNVIIQGRIEAYSCKPTEDEKRLHKKLNSSITQSPQSNSLTHSPKIHASSSEQAAALLSSIEPLMSGSPSMHGIQHSHSMESVSSQNATQHALSNLNDSHTRKLLVQLITTMNNVFLDYDFSSNIDRIANKFIAEQSTQSAITTINNLFVNSVNDTLNSNFRTELWNTIDECIELDKCDVYTYNDDDNVELSAGKLWVINYFFYNKKLKKILFLGASAANKLHNSSQLDNDNSVDSTMFAMRQYDTTDSARLRFDDDNDSSDSDVAPHVDADDISSDEEYDALQQSNKSLADYNQHTSLLHTTLSPHIQVFNVDKAASDTFQLDSNTVKQPSNLSTSMFSTGSVQPTKRRV